MYDQRSKKTMLQYKYKQKTMDKRLLKIKFLLSVGQLTDVLFIKATLKKKSLIKQLFVLDVEHSCEVFIPDELSCDKYPYSFRYYDPIIQIINELFSMRQKQFHCLRTEFYLKKNKDNDIKKEFLEAIGAL